MAQGTIEPAEIRTVADLVKRLGNIPLDRIRFQPPLGTASEKDVIDIERRRDSLCELVDGTIVDKAAGFKEALVTSQISYALFLYLERDGRGICVGGNCLFRLAPGLVRCPSVAFLAWEKFPNGEIPSDPIADLVPDLVAEVLRNGNTPAEMKRKVGEYFDAGVRLVWLIDPRKRAARVYTAPHRSVAIREDQSLDGGDVLPGFTVSLAELLRRIPRRERSDGRPADSRPRPADR